MPVVYSPVPTIKMLGQSFPRSISTTPIDSWEGEWEGHGRLVKGDLPSPYFLERLDDSNYRKEGKEERERRRKEEKERKEVGIEGRQTKAELDDPRRWQANSTRLQSPISH